MTKTSELVLAQAREIANHGPNIAYVSRATSERVRQSIRDLLKIIDGLSPAPVDEFSDDFKRLMEDPVPVPGEGRDVLVEALRELADACDAVGVRFFDTDTMEPEVEAMQTATQNVRKALSADEHERNIQAAFDVVPLCDDCGTQHGDPPSKLCPGCQAYRDHQA